MHSKWVVKQFSRLLPEFLAMLLLLTITPAYAATVAEESELKAAFVYNFTLFTTWPKASNTLNLCVFGKSAYLPFLKVYNGRVVNDSTIKVTQVDSATEARSCQVLFIDTNAYAQIDSIYQALEGVAVLTVTEASVAIAPMAHIGLMRINGRMQFEINQTEALISNLKLSYKLLKLAKKVY
ncbi:MAG: YfiR family protein [Methylotenera sp.]|nr:YfiR family protein [Methylotenera sp.]